MTELPLGDLDLRILEKRLDRKLDALNNKLDNVFQGMVVNKNE